MSDITVSKTQLRVLEPAQVTQGVAGSAMSVGDVVKPATDEQWDKAIADTGAHAQGLLGLVVAGGKMVMEGGVAGDIAAGDKMTVLLIGRVKLADAAATLSESSDYYLSGSTAGVIVNAAPTVRRFLGTAESEQVLFFNPVGNPASG
jgi:hypothetical protein